MDVAKQLIAFCHFKGGVGTSFIASNIAVAIARKNIQTCLVDFNYKYPNCHNMLGIKVPKNRSMYSFINVGDPENNYQDFFINNKGKSEKLYLLSGSNEEEVEILEDINDNRDDVSNILDIVREIFDVTVVDLPIDYQNPPVIEVLRRADKVFVVGDQDINTVDNTIRSLNMYKAIDIPLSKFMYLPNKYLEGYEVDVSMLKKTLPIRVTEPIPFDYETVLKCIAKSHFIGEGTNRISIALKSILDIILIGYRPEKEKKKSLFKFSKRGKSRKQPVSDEVKYIISDDGDDEDFASNIDDAIDVAEYSDDDWGDYSGYDPDEGVEI